MRGWGVREAFQKEVFIHAPPFQACSVLGAQQTRHTGLQTRALPSRGGSSSGMADPIN